MEGMGLLPIATVFNKEKVRTRIAGNINTLDGIFGLLNGVPIEGYEIHMGVSSKTGRGNGSYFSQISACLTERMDGNTEQNESLKSDGYVFENVIGTYVHGIFDSEEFIEGIIKTLYKSKGLEYNQVKSVDLKAYKEMQYDKLADTVRNNLDIDFIYRILEEAK